MLLLQLPLTISSSFCLTTSELSRLLMTIYKANKTFVFFSIYVISLVLNIISPIKIS